MQGAGELIVFNGPAATHARLESLGAEIIRIAYLVRDRAFVFKPVDDLIIPLLGAMARVGATIRSTDRMMRAGMGLERAVAHCFRSLCYNARGALQESQWHLFCACREAIASVRQAERRVARKPARAAPGRRPSLAVFPSDAAFRKSTRDQP